MTAWTIILAVGIGSYAMRAVMLAVAATKPLPQRYDAAMRFVGPAAIGALTATLTLTRAGTVHPLPIPELVAISVGFATVRRTGNVMHAITVGFPTLWLLTAVAR